MGETITDGHQALVMTKYEKKMQSNQNYISQVQILVENEKGLIVIQETERFTK